MYNYGEIIERSFRYLRHCSIPKLVLLNSLQGIDNTILDLSDPHIVVVLLHGKKLLAISSNTNILHATIAFFSKPRGLMKTFLKVNVSEMTSCIFIFAV